MGNCALYMYAPQISQNNCFGYNHKLYDSKHQNHEFGCYVQCNGFGLPVMDTWVIHTRQPQKVLSRMHKKKKWDALKKLAVPIAYAPIFIHCYMEKVSCIYMYTLFYQEQRRRLMSHSLINKEINKMNLNVI